MKIKHRIFGIMLIIIVSLLMLFCSQSKEIPAEYLPGRGMTLSSSNVVKHEKLLGSINFLGVPDDQEIRKIISDEPPVEVVIISKVQMTTADIFDERLTAYRSLPTQRVGRYLYFARISTDAYVFPDSTPEKPHIIRYNKTKRFVAYIHTAEEKEAITQERRRRIRELYSVYSQADPEHEVMRSLEKNDRRLVAVMNVGTIIPASTKISSTVRQFGCKIIPYTSDCYQSEIEEKFNMTAYIFAKQYNDILMKRVLK